jgi:hypothetical protein
MKLTSEQHRMLELLSGRPAGVTEAILVAHGVSIYTTAALIREGLATSIVDTVR